MTGLLGELGKKLAERWLATVVLPGLLLLGTAVVAVRLGQRHPFDAARLTRWLDALAGSPTARNGGTVLLLTAGALLAAGATGLAAGALGAAAGRWCEARSGPLVRWRRRRWERADQRAREALRHAAGDVTRPYPPLADALRARDAIGLREPARPTWVADRFLAVDQRVAEAYALDLSAVWPRLWLIADEPARAQVSAAQDGYGAALRLSGWGVLYLALGLLWSPSAVAGAVVLAVARFRIRRAAAVLAEMVESTVDLHVATLAQRMGFTVTGRLDAETGRALTAALRKDLPLRLPG
ncbi:hypothetical protein [Actinoplanes sp. NPDC049265]|uniref:hypothetical protein n=1 Tax=Actinoplanes sp. NPDC049265 TaxID=3363902 RepID=UPI003711F7AE